MPEEVSLKCKYYGWVVFPLISKNNERFPFFNQAKLIEYGNNIIKYQKKTKKSIKKCKLNIDNIKLNIMEKDKTLFKMISSETGNPWSCIISSKNKKMISIFTLTRDDKGKKCVSCDVIKIQDKPHKIIKMINIYKSHFVRLVSNINIDQYFEDDDGLDTRVFDEIIDYLNRYEDNYYLNDDTTNGLYIDVENSIKDDNGYDYIENENLYDYCDYDDNDEMTDLIV